MNTSHDEFLAAFRKFMDQTSVADAMSVATGMFVSLVVGYTEQQGEDGSKSITVDGGDQRDITIHAVKDKSAARKETQA